MKNFLFAMLFLSIAGQSVAQCSIVPPECVDVTSFSYEQTIATDPWCCNLVWDSICQADYNSMSPSCNIGGCTDPEALNYVWGISIDDGSCEYTPMAIVLLQDMTPQELVVNMLLGSGVLVSNVQYTGNPEQIAGFSNIGQWLDWEGGLVLSTAYASNLNIPAINQDFQSGSEPFEDPDLLAVANSTYDLLGLSDLNGQPLMVYQVNDICALEFDFIPIGDNISFDFLFGSDEYLEFVNTIYNDVFAFFLTGPGIAGPYANGAVNIAVVPESDPLVPITVSSVNDQSNSASYIHNIPYQNININGYTTEFTASHAGLTAGETYHIRLAIADGSDYLLGSFVFLEAGSFTSETEAEGSPADLNGDGWLNVNDLLILLGDYGCQAPPACLGDLNDDGEVNFEDVLEFLAAFG